MNKLQKDKFRKKKLNKQTNHEQTLTPETPRKSIRFVGLLEMHRSKIYDKLVEVNIFEV